MSFSEEEVEKAARLARPSVPKRLGTLVLPHTEKRAIFFKGKRLVAYLQSEAFGKKFARRTLEAAEAERLAAQIVRAAGNKYCMLVQRHKENKKVVLAVPGLHPFNEESFYHWVIDESSPRTALMSAAIALGFVAIVMFPVWPVWARVGVWYLSVTLLILIFLLIVVRYIIFLLTWVVGYETWLFPNLWDDNANIADSFKPVYTVAWRGTEQLKWRLVTLAAILGLAYWVYTQPTEFDHFLDHQREFVESLYSGTLLSDTSQAEKESIDEIKVPDLAELEREAAAGWYDDDTESMLNNLADEAVTTDGEGAQAQAHDGATADADGSASFEAGDGAARDEL